MTSLRLYQTRAIGFLRDHVLAGRRRVILTLPTGGGKMVLCAAITESARRNFDGKVLFVAHRMELIDQCVAQLKKFGVTEIGVIRADDERTNMMMPVQVASVQTLARRKIAFEPTIVITDECHRSCAESYMKFVFDAFPDAVHVGLTATPCRTDGKPLGRASGGPFDALEVAATYTDLIKDGFICKPTCFSTPEKYRPDLSGVHTIAGDYNLEELENVMTGGVLVSGIYERWKELSDGRRTVIFATGIQHSQAIVQLFQENNVSAAHLDGNTPEDLRREILHKLDTGTLQVVSNCQILTEGWDQPSAKCVIVARPTKSFVLYRQMVGRVLRPCCECGHPPDDHDPPKEHGACTECGCLDMKLVTPLILDHGGTYDRHGAPHEDVVWDINGPPKRTQQGKFKTCPKCFAYIAANERECPHCGHSFAADVDEREGPRVVDLPLVERTLSPDEKRRFFDQMVRLAKSRGYKPGFPSAKYKEKYGAWPPWAWKEEIQAMYDTDPVWQLKKSQAERFRAMRTATTEEIERMSAADLESLANEAFREWDE